MNAPDTGLRHVTVRVWEECIWLDRREDACPAAPVSSGRLARVGSWLRSFRARMQLGPSANELDWAGGDPEKRF